MCVWNPIGLNLVCPAWLELNIVPVYPSAKMNVFALWCTKNPSWNKWHSIQRFNTDQHTFLGVDLVVNWYSIIGVSLTMDPLSILGVSLPMGWHYPGVHLALDWHSVWGEYYTWILYIHLIGVTETRINHGLISL